MRAMITVCGKYGDGYWVSDLMLTLIAKLSQRLAKRGVEVIYADSVNNAQMQEIDGILCEARLANVYQVDTLFLIYRDEQSRGTGKLFRRFALLRSCLSTNIQLVLVDSFSHPSLTTVECDKLLLIPGITFSDGIHLEACVPPLLE